jgi:hypothetical protein
LSRIAEHTLHLTAKELQTLTAAMAGNFPASLEPYRNSVVRKLYKAETRSVSFNAEVQADVADPRRATADS